MRLLTIEELRLHCRTDSYDDVILTSYAEAAEQSVEDFLNRRVYATADELAAEVLAGTAGADPMVVNAAIKAAILLRAGQLYKNREAVTEKPMHELPLGFLQLLWPHRVGIGI